MKSDLTFKGRASCLSTPAWCLRKTNVRYIDRRTTLVLRSLAGSIWHIMLKQSMLFNTTDMKSQDYELRLFFLIVYFSFQPNVLFHRRELRLASRTEWMNVNKLCQALTKLISRKCWGGKKKLILFIVTFLWRYEPRASGGFHESLSFLCIRVIVIVRGKEIKYFVLVNKGVLCPAPSMLRSVADF